MIKRGTEITRDLLQNMLVGIYKNLNQIPSSNMVFSTKNFSDLEKVGAYKDSVITNGCEKYLNRYYDYVNLLKEM